MGNEFKAAQWLKKDHLDSRGSNTLIKKLKTIYNQVECFGQSDNRLYIVKNKKEEIVLNQNFIKNTTPKKKNNKTKNVKPTAPVEEDSEEVKEVKNRFLENYFEYKKIVYREEDKQQKLVEINYEPRTLESKRAIKSLYKKYRFIFTWEEFISIIMLLVNQAVSDFKPNDDSFKWEEINIDNSKSNLILHKFVYNSYIDQIKQYRFIGQDKKSTSRWAYEDGKKVKRNVIIDFSKGSTDIDISLDDGDTNVNQTLSDQMKFGYQNGKYHPNLFLHWFNDNKDILLTDSQKEFIDIMSKNFHESGSKYTLPYSIDEKQPYSCNSRRNRMHRIKTKVINEWEKRTQEERSITLIKIKKDADIQLLNELIHIVYCSKFDHVGELNEALSNWIYEQLNNDSNAIINELLHKELHANELKHMNTALINGYTIHNKVLYKIVQLVEDKIKSLERFNTDVNEELAVSTSNWTREEHQAYSDYLKAFKNQPIKVYDLKTGEFLRHEKVVKSSKKYKVFKLDTYGVRHELDEHTVGID